MTPEPGFAPLSVVIEDDDGTTTTVDTETGTTATRQPDGGVVVHLDARKPKAQDDGNDFYANLADDIDPMKLSLIGNDLYDAIQSDDNSRQTYLANRARGLGLLGLELTEPKSTVGDSAAPLDGMSSVTNPLLLENCLKGWANTVGELLPAAGPVKIQDDGTDETSTADELAEALERDMNHYLTKTASEFYPDTSHMILWGPYFGGSGFKKAYRCPMRRRPVSESVDSKDLIVSDTTKDLGSCDRITHQISMRQSVMKRMKFIGAYRDIAASQPVPAVSVVDNKIAMIQGVNPTHDRPEDQPYTIWECQCMLDIPDGFDHPSMAGHELKDEGIPLPYIVTLDKDTRDVLAIRRDWKEPEPIDTDEYAPDSVCDRKRMYQRYPYVPGPGFYGTGMLNILGNASAAMTAAWREALDAGMFASFPGGLIDKSAVRQNTANFRVGPGEFAPIDTGNRDIKTMVMGMPYKDVTPGLMALIDKITAQSDKLGGAADIPAGEGLQNIPVGTMLAQIEQATKVMSAAHKGMHTALTGELEMIIDLFRENPEDFWRNNKIAPKDYWNAQKFLQALEDYDLVPVSDPNVPSHIHRIMKAVALLQLLAVPDFKPLLQAKEVLMRCLRALKEDPNGLVIDAPAAPQTPPDLKGIAAVKTAEAKGVEAQTKAQKAGVDAQEASTTAQLKERELQTEKDIAVLNVQKEAIIHQHDAAKEARAAAHDQALDIAEHGLAERQHGLDVGKATHDAALATSQHALDVHQAMNPPEEKEPSP